MTKYLLVFLFGALAFEPAAHAQFGMAASLGAATSRKITEQMNSSLRNGTRGFGGGSAKGGKGGGAAAQAKPAANVPPPPPPPPPLQRVISNTRKNTAPAWMLEPRPMGPPPPPKPPVNVDLTQVERGMARESLLALGSPSSKMTLFEEGHFIEIYRYRNQTVASGTVRLSDGAVVTIEPNP